MKQTSRVMWGIVLVFLGAVYVLNILEITDINLFFKGWWTLLIIIPSFISMFTDSDKTGGIIGLTVGLMLLLGCRGYVDFRVMCKLVVPVIFIFVGLMLIFKNAFNKETNEKMKKLKNNVDMRGFSAVFSTKNDVVSMKFFDGANYTAICGTVNSDISSAFIEKDVLIKVENILGNVNISVPENVNVSVTSHSLFGGINNRVVNSDANAVTVYVKAYCLLGNAEVTSKQ